MLRPPRPRRFMLFGVPMTYELVLRLVLLCMTLAVLVIVSIPKVKSILQQAKVVSVTMTDSDRIPVPGVLICGRIMEKCDVQMLSRGYVYDNGTVGPDMVRDVPPNLWQFVDSSSLKLRANGDWPTDGKCAILKPANLFYGKNLGGKDPDALDQIIFVAQTSQDFNISSDIGLSIAIWDGDVPMEAQQPIWTGIPSINTLTFIYSEHILINQPIPQTRFIMQKQNLRTMQPKFFANQKVIGRVLISPDTFFVTRYLDKPSYTWVDLAGALGGMASIALAVWIFLFGSGKYKSWGVMQRYVLRTSPNSRRSGEKEVPKTRYESFKIFMRRQISRLDSSTDPELHNASLHDQQDPRRYSQHYSHVGTFNAAAATAGATKVNAGGLNGKDSEGLGAHRYSMDSAAGGSDYYFTEQGAPRSQALLPLAPINDSEDDIEEQVSELIRLIDLRVDERMWSLEKTLARYYLDGFRLRNYSFQNRAGGLLDEEHAVEGGAGPQSEEDKNRDHSAHIELLHSHSDNTSGSTIPGPFTPPLYPPRPQLNQQYHVVGNRQSTGVTSSAGSTGAVTAEGLSSPNKEELSLDASPPSSHSSGSSGRALLESGVPQRGDMRGTIRMAVTRLQNEWPQDRGAPSPGVYVPRTQYQTRPNPSPNTNLAPR